MFAFQTRWHLLRLCHHHDVETTSVAKWNQAPTYHRAPSPKNGKSWECHADRYDFNQIEKSNNQICFVEHKISLFKDCKLITWFCYNYRDQIYLLCHTETWLEQENYSIINESTLSNHLHFHITGSKGKEEMYRSEVSINPRPINCYNSVETRTLIFPHSCIKAPKPLFFVVLYHPPGSYFQFVVQISNF